MIINVFCYSLFIVWACFSIKWIYKLSKSKDLSAVNLYLYDAIPSVFTMLGVFGTFIGIFVGLQNFDVAKITESIPTLLEGLKTAFLTSIVGLMLSFVFGRISQRVLNKVEKATDNLANNELSALQEIIKLLKDSKKEANENLLMLIEALVGSTDGSILTQLAKLNTQSTTNQQVMKEIKSALGGDAKKSLFTQLQELGSEQKNYSKETKEYMGTIIKSMNDNSLLVTGKFDKFSELLAKNNTEALVNVMKEATEQFNAQMSTLIEKLVKENFEELNNSVQSMNQWQQENKEMIISLTSQFTKVSEDFMMSSFAIQEITTNTNKLTDDNSHLSRLIKELQKVMIDDTKYQEVIHKLVTTIDTLKKNTEAFDGTTNKLNKWVIQQVQFSDSVAKLLTRLEGIEKIKDINDVFWNNTKKQMTEGVNMIANASKMLSNDLDNINEEFYTRLNDTLQNLDTLIQRIIANYRR